MAKRSGSKAQESAQSSLKVRFVDLELNGSPSTIEEALRTVQQMRQPLIVQTPVAGNTSTAKVLSDEPVDEEILWAHQNNEGSDEQEIESETLSTDEPVRQRRGDGPKVDRNAGIEPVADLDFFPDAHDNLKDFFATKAPTKDMEKVLVIAFYLTNMMGLPSFTPGHVLSGLKHVGQRIPKDLPATIRNMKSKKTWLKFTDLKQISLATEGENTVLYELPAVSTES
ncbi:MAG: hypothetical protein AAGI54_04470 [Planctomycetota bacterium]